MDDDRIEARTTKHGATAHWHDWTLTATWGESWLRAPTSITISRSDGAAFPPSAVRQLPIAGMVAVLQLAGDGDPPKRGSRVLTVDERTRHQTGRGQLSREVLGQVAQVYIAAKSDRRPTTKAVAEAFGLSIRGAEKRIAAAKAAGALLPQAEG